MGGQGLWDTLVTGTKKIHIPGDVFLTGIWLAAHTSKPSVGEFWLFLTVLT